MGLFDGIGSDAVKKLDPIMRDAENRLGGILHGILDRLNGTEITIKVNIPPVPRAKPNNPLPN